MTSSVTTKKEWSTPMWKNVIGEPPPDNSNISQLTTKKAEYTSDNIRMVTPVYKSSTPQPHYPNGDVGKMPTGISLQRASAYDGGVNTGARPDYKVEQKQDHFRLQIIDPKVESHANLPASTTLPSSYRKKAPLADFPSTHTKRSFLKLDPLEQRKFRSVETRPITTDHYLTETVERHRDMEQSKLKEYLKVKESQVKEDWDKPRWPGPKPDDTTKNMKIDIQESLQKSAQPDDGAKVRGGTQLLTTAPAPYSKRHSSDDLHRRTTVTPTASHYKSTPVIQSRLGANLPRPVSVAETRSPRHEQRASTFSEQSFPSTTRPTSAPSYELMRQEIDHQRKLEHQKATSYNRYPLSPFSGPISQPNQHLHQEFEPVAVFADGDTSVPIEHQFGVETKPSTLAGQPPPPLSKKPKLSRSELELLQHHVETTEIMDQTEEQRMVLWPPLPADTTGDQSFLARRRMQEAERQRQWYEQKKTEHSNIQRSDEHMRDQQEYLAARHQAQQEKLRQMKAQEQNAQPNIVSNTNTATDIHHHQQQFQTTNVERYSQENSFSFAFHQEANEQQQRYHRHYEHIDQRRATNQSRPPPPAIHTSTGTTTIESPPRPALPPPIVHTTGVGVGQSVPHPASTQKSAVTVQTSVLTTPAHTDTPTTPGSASWKRTYVVEAPEQVVKNRITTSADLLTEEGYYVDLLSRRDAFIEKAAPPPEIHRLGRRWQPPPDKPYVWPSRRSQPRDPSQPQMPAYQWEPLVSSPEFRHEHKNFMPSTASSPPPDARSGTQPLDLSASRQLAGVTLGPPTHYTPGLEQPPQPTMRHGYHQAHQPSTVVPEDQPLVAVDRRQQLGHQPVQQPVQVAVNMPESSRVLMTMNRQQQPPAPPPHQPPRIVGGPFSPESDLTASSGVYFNEEAARDNLNPAHHFQPIQAGYEWEKIYELPPHSSVIVGKDVPLNVNIRDRMRVFEALPSRHVASSRSVNGGVEEHAHRGLRRSSAAKTEDYNRQRLPAAQQAPTPSRYGSRTLGPQSTPLHPSIGHHLPDRYSPLPAVVDPVNRTHQHAVMTSTTPSQSRYGSRSLGVSRPPAAYTQSTSTLYTPNERHPATADRYSPLPPVAVPVNRLAAAAANTQKREPELQELASKREQLLERAKHRPDVNRLIKTEIEHKDAPPVPLEYKDKVREMLDSRTSNVTSSASLVFNSGASENVTESTATWQFAQNDAFSPRSVISVNGAKNASTGDLLRVRTDLSPLHQLQQRNTRHSSTNAAVQTLQNQQQQQWQYLPVALLPVGGGVSPGGGMREWSESSQRRRERYNSMPVLDDDALDRQSTLIRIKDEKARGKPRSIMKHRSELESKEAMLFPNRVAPDGAVTKRTYQENKQDGVKEIVERVETNKRTEEIERKVQRAEKKHRRRSEKGGGERHHRDHHDQHRTRSHRSVEYGRHGDDGGYPWTQPIDSEGEEAEVLWPAQILSNADEVSGYVTKLLKLADAYYADANDGDTLGYSSMRQNGHGYPPAVTESYHRQTTTRRQKERDHSSSGAMSAEEHRNAMNNHYNRYGTLSDSLRRGELKYNPNGELRERHSSRRSSGRAESYHRGDGDESSYHTYDSYRTPMVEFPPTLPRAQHEPPAPPPHRNGSVVHKSRSFADWENERNRDWTMEMRRLDGDDSVTKLERDFRDNLLMPLPVGQTMNEHEYRQENIPGGHESLKKDITANSGTRKNPGSNNVTHFTESKQELNFKREAKR